jgi:hypothetical protein
MIIQKVQWIVHKSDKKKCTPIFTIDIHPLGEKVATGGLGKCIFFM